MADNNNVQVKFNALKSKSEAESQSGLHQGTIYFSTAAGNNPDDFKIFLNGKDYTGYHKPSTGIPQTDLSSDTSNKINEGHYVNEQLYNKKVTAWSNGGSDVSDANFPSEKLTYDSLATKAPIASPAFTGTPTIATTPTSGDNSHKIADTAFVQSEINAKIAAADAMLFAGTLSIASGQAKIHSHNPNIDYGTTVTDDTTLLTSIQKYSAGWTWKVAASDGSSVSGLGVLEVGDMLIADTDITGTSFSTSDWSAIQGNINGAVTGPATSSDGHVAVFDGTTGKLIKDAGISIDYVVRCNAQTSGNIPTFTAGLNGAEVMDSEKSFTDTVRNSSSATAYKVPTEYAVRQAINAAIPGLATTSANGLMSSTDKTKLDGIENGAQAHIAPTAAEVKSALGTTGSSSANFLCESGDWLTPPDTKNTAGADDSSSKLFIIGTLAQTTNNAGAQTYSNDKVYIGADDCLYSNGEKVATETTAKIYWENE